MRITINIKPNTMTGECPKYAFINTIASRYRATTCGDRLGYGLRTDTSCVLYNLEKRRRKSKLIKVRRSTRHPNGMKRELVRSAHWKAYIYVIPKDMLKKAVQGDRNFSIELKLGEIHGRKPKVKA
jgi:hypothetical protein